MDDFTYPCIVCGKALQETRGHILSCSYCGQHEKSDFQCEEGHFVCESCRVSTLTEIILTTCKASTSTDPLLPANLLMHHPAISMSGPEHHFLVPAVLISVAYNAGFDISLHSRLRQAMKRAGKFGLGSCASMGACGAAMGVPIAISLLIGADYTKPIERKSVLHASASATTAIADLPAPRCCKASVYSSLSIGASLLGKELGLQIPHASRTACQFQDFNAECVGSECPYYKESLHRSTEDDTG